jgi:Xaa-Pro aminopeptidase
MERGHGLGLEIHESPRVSSQSSEILEKNMLITIEPGIYIPGWGGIRIEDTVIVKDGGCEIITHSDKNLIIDGGIK